MTAKKREDIEKRRKPIWQFALELGQTIPDEELAALPKDLARNLDHYLYGVPKDEA